MKMLPYDNLKAVCSVTEMTKKLGLSRARFYQLQKMGIFPKPVYLGNPDHPFYPLDLQQKCIEIRKTGIGINGQPIIFYASREKKSQSPVGPSEQKYEKLVDALRQMDKNVTLNKVKAAVKVLYPEGLTKKVDGRVIVDLYRYLDGGV